MTERAPDGTLVAGREFRRGEVVDVVHRAHAAAGRVGADAVLGVHDVVAARVEGVPQRGDRAEHALSRAFALPVREWDDDLPDR